MSFGDITGNARIKKILTKALHRGRIPNSLLFSGPPGVGKIEMAHVVAKALNCLQREDDACEACSSCLAINQGAFPDVMLVAPEKDVLKIDQMRVLKEAAYLRPMIGRTRVFIVDPAESMNREASNSLLKVLEEPPSFSHIILITSNPFVILPTIKSRCQVLSFSPVSRDDIERCLIDQNFSEDKARILSLLVRGNLKQAMNMDWEDIRSRREDTWRIFLTFLHGEPTASFFKEYSARSRDAAAEEMRPILELLASFCRDLLLVKEGADPGLLLNPDFEALLRGEAGSVRTAQVLGLLGRIEKWLLALQKNMNIKLFMSSLIMDTMDCQHV
jgi:DNA polymerase III delta' subunit